VLRTPGVRRSFGLRTSVITFVLMSAGVVVVAMALLVLIDPRTQDYWSGRFADLTAWVRTLLGR